MSQRLALAIVFLGAPSAWAAPILFTATLTGPDEVPPNASPATGTAMVTIDDAAHTMRVEVTFSGLVGTTTASHIHVIDGPGDITFGDTAGPVATTTPSFVGFPLGVTSGSMDETYDTSMNLIYRPGFLADAGGTALAAEAALFDAIIDGRAYLNIHSNVFPGGEIRGFLTPAPEPSLLALLAAGGAGFLARRRTRSRS